MGAGRRCRPTGRRSARRSRTSATPPLQRTAPPPAEPAQRPFRPRPLTVGSRLPRDCRLSCTTLPHCVNFSHRRLPRRCPPLFGMLEATPQVSVAACRLNTGRGIGQSVHGLGTGSVGLEDCADWKLQTRVKFGGLCVNRFELCAPARTRTVWWTL